MNIKCDFCDEEYEYVEQIWVGNQKYYACPRHSNRIFKLIKRMIREYVKGQ
jgi:hypothetical protein